MKKNKRTSYMSWIQIPRRVHRAGLLTNFAVEISTWPGWSHAEQEKISPTLYIILRGVFGADWQEMARKCNKSRFRVDDAVLMKSDVNKLKRRGFSRPHSDKIIAFVGNMKGVVHRMSGLRSVVHKKSALDD